MATQRYRLVIGNKNWSSWSLRPWLAMKRLGVPFEGINVRLRGPDSKEQLLKYCPSGSPLCVTAITPFGTAWRY
jgi:glutathione S-transferase